MKHNDILTYLQQINLNLINRLPPIGEVKPNPREYSAALVQAVIEKNFINGLEWVCGLFPTKIDQIFEDVFQARWEGGIEAIIKIEHQMQLTSSESMATHDNIFAFSGRLQRIVLGRQLNFASESLSTISVGGMIAAAIGKQLARERALKEEHREDPLFPVNPYPLLICNVNTLALRLKQLMEQEEDFVINALVAIMDIHIQQTLCFNSMNELGEPCVKIISLDYWALHELMVACARQGVRIERLVSDHAFLKADSGCKSFALYFSEKMSHIKTSTDAEILFSKIKKRDRIGDGIHFSHTALPLRFGAMTVCQSYQSICNAQKHIASNSEDALNHAINHRGETLHQVLAGCIRIITPKIKSTQANIKIDIKFRKQRIRAFNILALSQDEQQERLAAVLGFKDIYPDCWKELTQRWIKYVGAPSIKRFSDFDLPWNHFIVQLEKANNDDISDDARQLLLEAYRKNVLHIYKKATFSIREAIVYELKYELKPELKNQIGGMLGLSDSNNYNRRVKQTF